MGRLSSGTPLPLGASLTSTGVNFSLYSPSASAVQLLLFADAQAAQPSDVVPIGDRTLDYWHVHVAGIAAGQLYALRVNGGPPTPRPGGRGNRFDVGKVLIDPYALANADNLYVERDACIPGDNAARAMRSIVVDPSRYDWEGDTPPRTPWAGTVIYELHVRGFTRSPSSGCSTATASR